MKQEIVIIGTGNVAFHLMKFLSKEKFKLAVIGRNKGELEIFEKLFKCKTLSLYTEIHPDSLVIVCVPDQAISSVLTQIPPTIKVVCTSGSIDLNSLPKRTHLGVFYPLQTFSKTRKIDFSTIPFFIETSTVSFTEEMVKFATRFSDHVAVTTTEKRNLIHLTAVICNNFTNHLITLAKNQTDAQQLDFSVFHPLLKETINKLLAIGPVNAQTGPAKRNDLITINKHIALLEHDEQLKKLYILLTNSILNINGHKKL